MMLVALNMRVYSKYSLNATIRLAFIEHHLKYCTRYWREKINMTVLYP